MRTKNIITPGEILLEEFLKPMNISSQRLAVELSLSLEATKAILKGSHAITADVASLLGEYFGTGAEFWENLQKNFDSCLEARECELKVLRVRSLKPQRTLRRAA